MEKYLRKVSVFPSLNVLSGSDDNLDTIKITAEKWTIEIRADFNIYTDGSASGGLLVAGAVVVVTKGNPTLPKVVKTIRQRGVHFSCSDLEEKRKRYAGYKRMCRKILQLIPSRTLNLYVPLCLESLLA